MFTRIIIFYFIFQMILNISLAEIKASPQNENLGKVGLETLKQYAINHNSEVLSVRRSVEESKARYERTKSSFYPHLGIATGLENQMSNTKNKTGSLGYLSLSYNVLSGFDDSRKKQIAELELEKEMIRLQSLEFRIGLEVEKIFHTFVFKKSAIDLKSELLKYNEAHRKMAIQKRAAGMAAESDVMEFDLADALIKSDIVLLEQELEETRSQLKRLLGEDVGSTVEPVGVLRHEHLLGTLKENIENIETTGESIRAASKELAIASVQQNIWKSKWIPRVDLEGQAGYLPLEQSIDGGASARGVVLLKWNFFDGFDTHYERREQEFNYLKKEAELKKIILETISESEISHNRILSIQKRVDLEEKNENRAKSYYSSVMNEYKRGIKNSADLKLAAESLLEARLRRENFKYQFLVQRLELERFIGSQIKTELIEN